MKSKKILAFVLAMLMIIGITACGHSTTSSQSTPASSGASGTAGNESKSESTAVPTTTKFTVWSRDTEDSVVGRAFKSDITAFSAEHPDLEIDYMSIPHGDVVTKWNTAFAAGTAPDVIDVGVSHIIQRVELGTIIPLDDYYATWDKKDDVASGMVDYGRYDDKIYAIAYNAAPPIMAWRKDYFEEAGLDPEKPPKDWAEMLQYAEKLIKKDGNKIIRGAVELPATRGANYLFQFFLQNDTDRSTYESGDPNFHEPATIEAGQFLANLAPYAFLKADGDTGVFISGNAAISLTIAPESLNNMVSENPDLKDKIGVTPSLTNKKGGIHAGAWSYAITSQAKDPDLAWSYIDFVFSKERCQARMNEVGIVPPINSLSAEYIALNPQFHEAQLKNLVQSQAYPKTSWTNLYEETLHVAYDKIIYNEATPEDALKDAETEIMSKR